MNAYDPETKTWKRSLIGAEGWTCTILTKGDKADLTRDRLDVVLEGESTFVAPDGTVEKSAETVTVVNEDKWISRLGETVVTFNRVGD